MASMNSAGEESGLEGEETATGAWLVGRPVSAVKARLKLRQAPSVQPIIWSAPAAEASRISSASSKAAGKSSANAARPGVAVADGAEMANRVQGAPGQGLRRALPLLGMLLCWGLGSWLAWRPEPGAGSQLARLQSLASARMVVIEPDWVYFSLPVEPIHQDRWVRSLNLKPIPFNDAIPVPNLHALETWEKRAQFVRPPYAIAEVEAWWALRRRKVTYGFFRDLGDGALLVMDLEANALVGWASPQQLRGIFN